MRCFITGAAGFIGFRLARLLLEEGHAVHGYDVRLKQRRLAMLRLPRVYRHRGDARGRRGAARPDIIVHRAAQAGVRYSLQNPRAYVDANIVGAFNRLQVANDLGPKHLLMASTSSVYGANTHMPFAEGDQADTPLTLYAATKKANEAMAHAYAHIHGVPTTLFRFFTVYGPWGRPDMALFKFTQGILAGTPIDIYNHGDMYRDFTYVDDLVRAIRLLIDAVPAAPQQRSPAHGWQPVEGDTLSPAAPWRVVNIGNSTQVRLLDFVEAIEAELGKPAIRRYLPMQTGDVPATWADCTLLQRLTGYRPQTPLREGVAAFVRWYVSYAKNE